MRILITNDDGIHAPGLGVLETIAADIAGEGGEVWTVAPAFEQSGVAHAISYNRSMEMECLGPRRYSVTGTPADCVVVALHKVMKDALPDVVLSGVNPGNNSGENTVYSGTVGAAMEAALHGVKGIALSQFMGPKTKVLESLFEASAAHGADVVRRLLEHGLWDDVDYRLFYNVNFPPVSAAEVKGFKVAAQGFRRNRPFGVSTQTSDSGRSFLWTEFSAQHEATLAGTDVAANIDGFISITPLRADLTAHDRLAELEAKLR